MLSFALVISGLSFAIGCRILNVSVNSKNVELTKLSLEEHASLRSGCKNISCWTDSGRAVYKSLDGLILFHKHETDSGKGFWMLGYSLEDNVDSALAYVESWAVEPELSHFQHDIFRTSNQDMKMALLEPLIRFSCSTPSDSIFFDSSATLQPELSGFYVARYSQIDASTVYVQIKPNILHEPQYLFHLPPSLKCAAAGDGVPGERCVRTTAWLVGDNYGVDAGRAYTVVEGQASAAVGEALAPPDSSAEWFFVSPSEEGQPWVSDKEARMLSLPADVERALRLPTAQTNIFQLMQAHRSDKGRFAQGHKFSFLRNNVPVPQIGLGTGGVYLENALTVFVDALSLGYRSFDLAREYGNEHIIPLALEKLRTLLAAQCLQPADQRDFPHACRRSSSSSSSDGTGGDVPVQRKDLFLQTKVWPTDLGFLPTTDAIDQSLRLLQTTYIDQYMLHWASCDKSIDWMHCETTVDAAGTWRESWRALERAYAEGRVLSIGVSNFDAGLLKELQADVASVLPHLVQNWAEPGKIDQQVRTWCAQHGALYQPYAPLRNLAFLPQGIRDKLHEIAGRFSVSEQAVALQFFLQTGALVIPRSSSWAHLQDNIEPASFALSGYDMADLGWQWQRQMKDIIEEEEQEQEL